MPVSIKDIQLDPLTQKSRSKEPNQTQMSDDHSPNKYKYAKIKQTVHQTWATKQMESYHVLAEALKIKTTF